MGGETAQLESNYIQPAIATPQPAAGPPSSADPALLTSMTARRLLNAHRPQVTYNDSGPEPLECRSIAQNVERVISLHKSPPHLRQLWHKGEERARPRSNCWDCSCGLQSI